MAGRRTARRSQRTLFEAPRPLSTDVSLQLRSSRTGQVALLYFPDAASAARHILAGSYLPDEAHLTQRDASGQRVLDVAGSLDDVRQWAQDTQND